MEPLHPHTPGLQSLAMLEESNAHGRAEAAAGSEADNERLKATETQLAELKDVQSKLPTAEKLAEVETQVAELKEAQSKLPTDEKLSAAVEEEKAARESALATLQEKVDELAKPAVDAAEDD